MKIEDKDTNASLNINDDGSASVTSGTASKTKIIDNTGNVIGATANALDVNIKSGGGSGGTAAADDADFTQGTTPGTPVMGVYEGTVTTVTDGDLGTVGIDENRNLKVNVVAGGAGGGVVTSGTAANLLAQVSQGTASNLKALVTLTDSTAGIGAVTFSAAGGMTVVQGTAANLKATVTQAATVTVHSGTAGSVVVRSGTAANLLSTVSGTVVAISGTAANLLTTVSGTVVATSGTAANLKVDGSDVVQPVLSGTAANFLTTVEAGTVTVSSGTVQVSSGTVTVHSGTAGFVLVRSGTAANLQATVTQAATVTVHTGTAGSAVVRCGTAANLLSTVSGTVTVSSGTVQVSAVTGTVTVNAHAISTVSAGTVTVSSGTVQVNTGTAGQVQIRSGTASNVLCTAAVTAGTSTIGHVVVHNELKTIFAGATTVAPQYAAVAISASGDNTVVSGVASKKIYVLSGVLMSSTVTNLKWWAVSTAGTALSGVMSLAANGGYQIPWTPVGAIATNQTGVSLILNSSAASTVGGFVTYVVV
jgi:hypothetical protein